MPRNLRESTVSENVEEHIQTDTKMQGFLTTIAHGAMGDRKWVFQS
jgi:hypothetical protein